MKPQYSTQYSKITDKLNTRSDQKKDLSHRLYGKQVMCLVPKDCESRWLLFKAFPQSPDIILSIVLGEQNINRNIIAFPENALSQTQRTVFLKQLLKQKNIPSPIIITTDPLIISDFADPLAYYIKVVKGKVKFYKIKELTFSANIFNNYALTVKQFSGEVCSDKIDKALKIINSKSKISKADINYVTEITNLTGDLMIKSILKTELDKATAKFGIGK